MLERQIRDVLEGGTMQCAFYVKNLKTQEMAMFREREVVPAASLIKVPLMAAVMRQVREGRLSLRQRVRVKEKDKVDFSILSLLETGNDYSLDDVMKLMIVQSDNTAANLLADLVGEEAINREISTLGLEDTVFRRKMMDFAARAEGRENLTTAWDMGRMMEILYENQAVDEASSRHMVEILAKQLDTSMMMLFIPDETRVAHKTGELERLDHEAAIVYLDRCDYVFTVLIWDAPSNNEARLALGKISRRVYEYFL